MQRTIRRLALVAASGAVIFGLAAAVALATTVSTEPASNKTTGTAVLNGVINTGGVATAWQFQWGKTTKYGKGTPLQQIAAGGGTVPVSATLTGLAPDTTYHFRLVATTGTGTQYYPLTPTFGNDETFTTKATGRMLLQRTRLVIINNFVTVPLRCLSNIKCNGRLTISLRARLAKTHKFARILCATHFYTIKKHKSGKVKIRVRGGCLAVIRHARGHKHTAKLSSNPRTGQHAVIKTVLLVLG